MPLIITLSDAVRHANHENRLALTVYSIPQYPNPRDYERIIKSLNSIAEVSIIETTIPVTSGFSPYANSTIVKAHISASKHSEGLNPSDISQIEKPSLFVLYKETVEKFGIEHILSLYGNTMAGFLLEWDEDGTAPYLAAADKFNVEYVREIDPNESDRDIEAFAQNLSRNSHVYLVSAAMTGAKLFDAKLIQSCAARIKSVRCDATVSCGFGVSTQEDVASVRDLSEVDGVIIGTAALNAMATGEDGLRRYLDHITPALTR